MRRTVVRRVLVGIVAVGIAAGSWFAARAFESPEQRAAAARPPAPTPIVAEVEVGRLAEPFTVTATVSAERSQPVVAPERDGPQVVTGVGPLAGGIVGPGDWLLAINDRPLLVLPGAFPLYRDLSAGMQGADVEQLQAGLRAAGSEIARGETGTFGAQTQRAVARLYELAGFSLPPAPPEQLAAIEELAATVAADPADSAAHAELDRLRAGAGPRLPRAEVVIVGALPASAIEVAGVGRTVAAGEQLVVLQSGGRRLEASVPTAVAQGLTVGMAVRVDLPGAPGAAGAIQGLEPRAPDPAPGAPPPGVRVLITADGPIDGAAGSEVLVRAERVVVDQEAAIVPATAVVHRGARSFVAVERGERFMELEVRTLGELAGRVAVEVVGDEPLVAADRVLLGDA